MVFGRAWQPPTAARFLRAAAGKGAPSLRFEAGYPVFNSESGFPAGAGGQIESAVSQYMPKGGMSNWFCLKPAVWIADYPENSV